MSTKYQLFTDGLMQLGLNAAQVEAITSIANVLFEGLADQTYFPHLGTLPTDTLYTVNRPKVNRWYNITKLKENGIVIPNSAEETSKLIREYEGKFGVSRTHSTQELKEWVKSYATTDTNMDLLHDINMERELAKDRDNIIGDLKKNGDNEVLGDAYGDASKEFDDEHEVAKGEVRHSMVDELTAEMVKSNKEALGQEEQPEEGWAEIDETENTSGATISQAELDATRDCQKPVAQIAEIEDKFTTLQTNLVKVQRQLYGIPALSDALFGSTNGATNGVLTGGILGRFLHGDSSLQNEFTAPNPAKYGLTEADFAKGADALNKIEDILNDFKDDADQTIVAGVREASGANPRTLAECNKYQLRFVVNAFAESVPVFKYSSDFMGGVITKFTDFAKYVSGVSTTAPFAIGKSKRAAAAPAAAKAPSIIGEHKKKAIEKIKAKKRGILGAF